MKLRDRVKRKNIRIYRRQMYPDQHLPAEFRIDWDKSDCDVGWYIFYKWSNKIED